MITTIINGIHISYTEEEDRTVGYRANIVHSAEIEDKGDFLIAYIDQQKWIANDGDLSAMPPHWLADEAARLVSDL